VSSAVAIRTRCGAVNTSHNVADKALGTAPLPEMYMQAREGKARYQNAT
jgi:hypothetical protein